jgi:hypothetical protein
VGYTGAQTGTHTDTQQEERPVTVGYTGAQTGTHTDTQQEERSVTVGYTSAQTGPHTHIQQEEGPSLWDTLAYRRDHTHIHTTGRMARHCGIH